MIKKYTAYILVIALVVIRFLFLDQDAPAYMIGGICQEDEIYYALPAVNKYNIDHDRTIKGFERVAGGGLMLYSAPLTYISMKCLGNNYWGFRISVVIVSLITILILSGILRRLKIDQVVIWLMMLYLLTDFYFFLFSRYQTPQIYSVAITAFMMWLYFRFGTSSLKGNFLLGFFALFAVCFIYVYNSFLVLAFGLLILRVAVTSRSIKPLVFFSAGAVVCVLTYLLVLVAVDSPVQEVIKLLTTHGGGIDSAAAVKSSGGVVSLVKGLYAKIIQLPATNLFRYNLAVLFIFSLTLPFIIYKAFKEKEEKSLMYFLLIFSLIAQSFFVVSYPFKKLIVVLPIVVIVIADSYNGALDFYRSIRLSNKLFLAIYAAIILFLCVVNYRLNNSKVYWDSLNYGYYDNTKLLFGILNWTVLGITVVIFTLSMVKDKYDFKTIFLLPSFLGIFLVTKYCLIEKTFCSRDGFTSVAPMMENKGVATNFVYAAQLYTNAKLGLGCYADKMLLKDKYEKISDSLFKSGGAEFTIRKIMPVDSVEQLGKEFVVAAEIPMKYYKFRIYRYKSSDRDHVNN